MQIVIDIPEEMYTEYVSVNLDRGNGKSFVYNLLKAIKNGTPLESYLPNERCDTCKYVDCSIDNEPCIDCKVPHKSFYEPRQEMSGGGEDGV